MLVFVWGRGHEKGFEAGEVNFAGGDAALQTAARLNRNHNAADKKNKRRKKPRGVILSFQLGADLVTRGPELSDWQIKEHP